LWERMVDHTNNHIAKYCPISMLYSRYSFSDAVQAIGELTNYRRKWLTYAVYETKGIKLTNG